MNKNFLKRIAIFDGNHLAYRAYYKFANLKTIDGKKTSIVYGMVYIIESLIRRLGPNEAIVVFDGGRSPFRMSLLPDYKKREKKLGFDYDDFVRQKETGKDILKCFGVKVAVKEDTEADDIIAMIAKRYSAKGWESVIVSGDKDFNQLLLEPSEEHGGINIFNTQKGILIEPRTLIKTYPYTPDKCVDFLVLTGDDSDHIPGYRGIGPDKAIKLLEEFGSIKSFLKSEAKFGKVDKTLLQEVYDRNKKLIDLKWYYRKFMVKEPIPFLNPKPELDFTELKRVCSIYEVSTFLKPQFIQTFKTLFDEK